MANFPSIQTNGYPVGRKKDDPAIRSPYENGSVQTRARFTLLREGFTLKWNGITNADRETLRTFWETVGGGSDSFNWTDPYDSTVYVVRFASDIRESQITDALWNIEVDIQEV